MKLTDLIAENERQHEVLCLLNNAKTIISHAVYGMVKPQEMANKMAAWLQDFQDTFDE